MWLQGALDGWAPLDPVHRVIQIAEQSRILASSKTISQRLRFPLRSRWVRESYLRRPASLRYETEWPPESIVRPPPACPPRPHNLASPGRTRHSLSAPFQTR